MSAVVEPPERLQAVLDSLLEGFQILDSDLRYVYLNPAAARHARKPREELVGRSMAECFPGIEATAMFARLEHCLREQLADQMENEFVYADGQRAWFELRMQPTPEGLVVISLDVTERKRMEIALRRSDKLAAMRCGTCSDTASKRSRSSRT